MNKFVYLAKVLNQANQANQEQENNDDITGLNGRSGVAEVGRITTNTHRPRRDSRICFFLRSILSSVDRDDLVAQCFVVTCPAGQRARCCQDWKLGFVLANAADFRCQFMKFFFLQLAFADWAASI